MYTTDQFKNILIQSQINKINLEQKRAKDFSRYPRFEWAIIAVILNSINLGMYMHTPTSLAWSGFWVTLSVVALFIVCAMASFPDNDLNYGSYYDKHNEYLETGVATDNMKEVDAIYFFRLKFAWFNPTWFFQRLKAKKIKYDPYNADHLLAIVEYFEGEVNERETVLNVNIKSIIDKIGNDRKTVIQCIDDIDKPNASEAVKAHVTRMLAIIKALDEKLVNVLNNQSSLMDKVTEFRTQASTLRSTYASVITAEIIRKSEKLLEDVDYQIFKLDDDIEKFVLFCNTVMASLDEATNNVEAYQDASVEINPINPDLAKYNAEKELKQTVGV